MSVTYPAASLLQRRHNQQQQQRDVSRACTAASPTTTSHLQRMAVTSLAWAYDDALSPCPPLLPPSPPSLLAIPCRLPSTVHALVTVWLVARAFLLSDDFTPSPGRPAPVLRTTPTTWTSVGFSLGYFAADTAMLGLVPAISSTPMAVHHIIALLSLGVAIQVGSMHIYLLAVLLTEITTPLVNLRFWLDQARLKHLPLYTANGVAMFLLWGPFRVFNVLPFARHVAANWQHVAALPWHGLSLIVGVPVLLCALNSIWYVKIAKGAWKLVFGPPRHPPTPTTTTSSRERAINPPPTTAAAPAGAVAAGGKLGGAAAAAANNRTVMVEAYSGRHSPGDRPHVE